MRKDDWLMGITALLITWSILGGIGMTIHANRYKAPTTTKMYRVY